MRADGAWRVLRDRVRQSIAVSSRARRPYLHDRAHLTLFVQVIGYVDRTGIIGGRDEAADGRIRPRVDWRGDRGGGGGNDAGDDAGRSLRPASDRRPRSCSSRRPTLGTGASRSRSPAGASATQSSPTWTRPVAPRFPVTRSPSGSTRGRTRCPRSNSSTGPWAMSSAPARPRTDESGPADVEVELGPGDIATCTFSNDFGTEFTLDKNLCGCVAPEQLGLFTLEVRPITAVTGDFDPDAFEIPRDSVTVGPGPYAVSGTDPSLDLAGDTLDPSLGVNGRVSGGATYGDQFPVQLYLLHENDQPGYFAAGWDCFVDLGDDNTAQPLMWHFDDGDYTEAVVAVYAGEQPLLRCSQLSVAARSRADQDRRRRRPPRGHLGGLHLDREERRWRPVLRPRSVRLRRRRAAQRLHLGDGAGLLHGRRRHDLVRARSGRPRRDRRGGLVPRDRPHLAVGGERPVRQRRLSGRLVRPVVPVPPAPG